MWRNIQKRSDSVELLVVEVVSQILKEKDKGKPVAVLLAVVALYELSYAHLKIHVAAAELVLDLTENFVIVLHPQKYVTFIGELFVVGRFLKSVDGLLETAVAQTL